MLKLMVEERRNEFSDGDLGASADIHGEPVRATCGIARERFLAALVRTAFAAVIVGAAGLIYCLEKPQADRDKQNKQALLDQFGHRGKVVQVYDCNTCAVENDCGQKMVVWFSPNTPVVEGETWEIAYGPGNAIFFLKDQVSGPESLSHP